MKTMNEEPRRTLARPPGRRLAILATLLALLAVGAPRLSRENLFSEGGRLEVARTVPEFPPGQGAWVGTEPMTTAEMRGRVWVLKVWTFGCLNCVRSIPFTNALAERYAEDLGVLGIHSPEFDWERDLDQLAVTIEEHGVRYPSYIDESLDYFFALDAPAWPAFYVVDRDLKIRGSWMGEVHEGTWRARELEELVQELIAAE